MQQMRWGVLGASSRIYGQRLAPAFEIADGHVVVAEARRAGVDEQPYAELLARDDVDSVYIPLPNIGHKPWVLAALAAGKHVLCEKPLTLSSADTVEVFAAAQAAGRTLLEAYMWPHHPRARRILTMVADGELGPLRSVRSTFTYPSADQTGHRFDERGAGALFDIGIYCIAPAMLMIQRDHLAVAATAVRNESGVDVAMTGFVDWGDGVGSSFDVSMTGPPRRMLEVSGVDGILTVPGSSSPGPEEPSQIVVLRRDDSMETTVVDGANAFVGMIEHFGDVVSEIANPMFGATESIRLAAILDALHAAAPNG